MVLVFSCICQFTQGKANKVEGHTGDPQFMCHTVSCDDISCVRISLPVIHKYIPIDLLPVCSRCFRHLICICIFLFETCLNRNTIY